MPHPPLQLELPDSNATEVLGRALRQAFDGLAPVGAVMHLHGELGAGKTTCVRSLLRSAGVTGLVRSPTYTLVETYVQPACTYSHVDLYRVRSATEVDELGLRELSGPLSLLMIEWPELGGSAVPRADLGLRLVYAGAARVAHLQAATPTGEIWLADLRRDSSLIPYVSNLT